MKTNKLRFVDEVETCSVAERKQALRTYMKGRRADNENQDVKERLLCQRTLSVVEAFEKTGLVGEKTAFVYLSFSSEAPTDRLIESLQEAGVKVFCPKIEHGKMYAVEYGEDFTLSAMGIREPVGAPFQGEIKYIIAPLLAVDRAGNRLGYGKGYYDAFFAEYPSAKRIGYGFDFQLLREVPCEPFDERLDVVVTDKQTLYTARN